MKMNMNIELISPTATMPTKAHKTDACFDLYADIGLDGGTVHIPAHKYATINTGIKTEIPNGYFAAVFPRSGMGIKRHLRLSNCEGIIDSEYRGEWLVALHNDGDECQIIHHGDRIAQFALLPVFDVELLQVEHVGDTERGDGGFGSSGR